MQKETKHPTLEEAITNEWFYEVIDPLNVVMISHLTSGEGIPNYEYQHGDVLAKDGINYKIYRFDQGWYCVAKG